MKSLLHAGLICLSTSLIQSVMAAEVQWDCKFESEVRVTHLNPALPQVSITKQVDEFLLFVDHSARSASYIDLKIKIKSPLTIAVARSAMTTFVERDGEDNHFSLSIFHHDDESGRFPAVMFSHAWQPTLSFFAPTIRMGRCFRV